MNKLSNAVLNNISENNNEYRTYLRELDSSIDEKTTALIGEVVTLSNYMVDFSNTIYKAKEEIVGPISKVVESYVIRDLRSVESVNEQFIEKINDKIDETPINNADDLNNFKTSLNSLLNDKYLEIVKIKRIDFFNENNTNYDVEKYIDTFISGIKSLSNFDENALQSSVNSYKNNIYEIIRSILSKINDLYLNNFVNEILNSLNISMDGINVMNSIDVTDDLISQIPTLDEYMESQEMNDDVMINDSLIDEIPAVDEDIIMPEASDFTDALVDEIPLIPDTQIKEVDNTVTNDLEELPIEVEQPIINEEVNPIEIPEIKPIEVNNTVEPKKTYDVEEILKIAKSPVVTMPEQPKKKENDEIYIHVSPIVNEDVTDTLVSEYDEAEIVEELINRLTKRLSVINERKAKYESLKVQTEEDEAFVNDLIESAESKKEELNRFEKELDEKEVALKDKEAQLNKKINDVMPFANALLKSEEESL